MVCWVGGRMYFVAPSCKRELARFSASLRIQDGAECGSKNGLNCHQFEWFEKRYSSKQNLTCTIIQDNEILIRILILPPPLENRINFYLNHTSLALSLARSIQLGLNHVCVILSCRRDTMYHICMILHFRHVFDTEKNIWLSLEFEIFMYFLKTYIIFGLVGAKKRPFQPLQKFFPMYFLSITSLWYLTQE